MGHSPRDFYKALSHSTLVSIVQDRIRSIRVDGWDAECGDGERKLGIWDCALRHFSLSRRGTDTGSRRWVDFSWRWKKSPFNDTAPLLNRYVKVFDMKTWYLLFPKSSKTNRIVQRDTHPPLYLGNFFDGSKFYYASPCECKVRASSPADSSSHRFSALVLDLVSVAQLRLSRSVSICSHCHCVGLIAARW